MSRQLAKQKCQQADSLLALARKKDSDRQLIAQAIDLYQEVIQMTDIKMADPYVGIAYLMFSAGHVERAKAMLFTAQEIEPMNMKVNLMLQRIEKAVSRGVLPEYFPLPPLSHTLRIKSSDGDDECDAFLEVPTVSVAVESVAEHPTEEAQPLLQITADLGPANLPHKVSEGAEVLLLQKLLLKLGFKLAVTQQYDAATFAAVRNFQARKMIPINGAVEQKTKAFFNHILSKMTPADLRMNESAVASAEGQTEIWEDIEPPEEFTADLGPAEQTHKVSSGMEVILLQELLKNLGHPVEISGEYDKSVLLAVRSLQSSHRLPVSGVVDAKTRIVLNQLLKTTFLENVTRVQLAQMVWRFRSERQLPVKQLFALYLDELFKQLFLLLKQPSPPIADIWEKPPPLARLLLTQLLGTAGQAGVTSEGDEVATLQDFLVREGFALDINHKFDLQTFTQIKAWQQQAGLAVTGEADAPTREAINYLLQSRYDEEIAIEAVWDTLFDFQIDLGTAMSNGIHDLVADLLQIILYGKTLPLLELELGPPNRPGKISQGFEVLLLQHMLRHLGYPLEITGSYDNALYNAVRSFQQKNQLPMTGMLDTKTTECLNPYLPQLLVTSEPDRVQASATE